MTVPCTAAVPGAPWIVKGACTSADGSAGCRRCEVTVRRRLELSAVGGSLIGACPRMVAGHYGLGVSVPVKLVPEATGEGPMFFQIRAAFAARARDDRGQELEILPETPPASWSWWTTPGVAVDRDETLELERQAAVQITFRLEDAQYYVPSQTQGDAHRDVELVIDPGTVIRLTRTSMLASEAKPQREPDLSDGTLAKITPGRTRKAEVEALLGKPLREVRHGDEENPANDVWDYRGPDSSVHVEFNTRGLVALIAKIPDTSRSATARVATQRTAAQP
jgi:hypothetical protein